MLNPYQTEHETLFNSALNSFQFSIVRFARYITRKKVEHAQQLMTDSFL